MRSAEVRRLRGGARSQWELGGELGGGGLGTGDQEGQMVGQEEISTGQRAVANRCYRPVRLQGQRLARGGMRRLIAYY